MTGIERERLSRGMTQTDFAELLGVTQATLSEWESRKSKPLPNQYPRIAKILKVTAIHAVDLFRVIEADITGAGKEG